MASQFQELSLTKITPDSFQDQIDFIFAVNNASDDSQPQPCDLDDDSDRSSVDDDDNDGFRTPTSPIYKIPVVEHCPPAPRRPKPISSSSSSRSSAVRRGFRVYISDQIVESIFSSGFGSDFLHQKNKKARKNENNGGE